MTFNLPLFAAGAVALLAGTVRGFSGFGGALIFVPLVSALYEPARAGPTLFLVDVALSIPMTLRSIAHCAFPQIWPITVAAAVFTPAGVWTLAVADPTALRWAISGLLAVLLALLMSGLRYSGRPPLPATLAVGAVSGFLGGAVQMSGAPVAALWLGGPGDRQAIRANLIVFFGLASVSSGAWMLAAGLFTRDVGLLALWLGPLYGLGIALGERRFVGASDAGYRRIAYAVIALAGVTSLPLFDGLWR